MDVGRLRALRELSIRKTMAAVAEALHVSPSAVSQRSARARSVFGTRPKPAPRKSQGYVVSPASVATTTSRSISLPCAATIRIIGSTIQRYASGQDLDFEETALR